MLPIGALEGLWRRHGLPGRHARDDHLGIRPARHDEAHHRVRHRARPALPSDHRGQGNRHRRSYRRRPFRPERGRAAGTRASSRCSASTLRDHETRYEYAQEWLDAVKLALVAGGGFRFRRPVLRAQGGARLAQALWRHAPAHHECRRLAHRAGLRRPQLRCALHVDAAGHVSRATPKNVRRGSRPGAAAKGASSTSTPSASSPAGSRQRGGRGILPPLDRRRMPTGRRSTASWR